MDTVTGQQNRQDFQGQPPANMPGNAGVLGQNTHSSGYFAQHHGIAQPPGYYENSRRFYPFLRSTLSYVALNVKVLLNILLLELTAKE